MRRKILALLLAAALALSLLAGCGGGKALSQVIVDLLDNLYSNVSVEADSDLTAALKQAAAEGGTEEEILSRMIEILNHKGGSITFTRLGSGQQGNHAVTLYFQPGTDPDAAARNALAQWAGTLGTLPDDGSYQADVAMIESENGYYIALDVEVLKAGKPDKPDKDEDDSTPTLGPTDVGFANDDYSVEWADEANNQKLFKVKTGAGLVAWANYVRAGNWNTNCTLEDNVDLADTGNWEPIGNNETPYTGTFNGNDKTVTRLTITSSNRYVGMFGYVDGTVQNVKLANVTVTSDYTVKKVAGYTGAVAGYLSSKGTITGCFVSGSVTINGTDGNAGGVVGSSSGAISNCKVNTLTIKGANSSGNVAGGVAGTNSKTIENCQVNALIITDVYTAGGVVGTNEGTNAALSGCSVNGSSVTGKNHAGGVVGSNGGEIIACYHINGSVSSSSSWTAGGVVGTNNRNGKLTACYHSGSNISGHSDLTGGVAGSNQSGKITDCYWSGNVTSGRGIGKDDSNQGQAPEVDGTNMKWAGAVTQMNTALSGTGWQYELTGTLPTLTKN